MLASLIRSIGTVTLAKAFTGEGDETAVRLAGWLEGQNVRVNHEIGEIVMISCECDLIEYELPFDEIFRTGRAKVTLPGYAQGETILVKAKVRYQ